MKKIITDNQKINELLTRGVENIYPSKDFLEVKLKSGKQLTLYLGIDPTGPTLHLGHAIVLMKLKEFQDLGHQVILLIGSFTGMIGDPSDKLAMRKQLTEKEVIENCRNYKKQAGLILDFSGKNPVKLEFNHQWWDKMSAKELIILATNFTVQQMLAREMFKKRIAQDKNVYLHEFLYPLLQAYDSVILGVDGEVGGNDQMFNMLAGRTLMKNLKSKEKFVLTTKLLIDPTGTKMGKSEGNMITLKDSPNEMYGKIMSWPDELIIKGFEICTRVALEKIKEYEKDLKQGVNPRDLKAKLAREIVKIYHGEKESIEAEKEFNKIFKEKEIPSEIEVFKISEEKINILDLLVKTKMVKSKGEARRLVEQGGIKVDEKVIKDWKEEIGVKKGMILQVGKRRFIRLELMPR